MNAYILITFAVILLAGGFILQNLYQAKMGTGITTIFVLSGEGTLEDIKSMKIEPEYIYNNISEFYSELNRKKENCV